jgi:hypothetical protein
MIAVVLHHISFQQYRRGSKDMVLGFVASKVDEVNVNTSGFMDHPTNGFKPLEA